MIRRRKSSDGLPFELEQEEARRAIDEEARTIVAIERRYDLNGSPKYMTPDGVEFVEKLARGGHTKASICARLRIDQKTLTAIAKRQPEVAEALEAGRALHEADLVDVLTAKALAGEVVPALFLLKARHGWREGDARDGGAQVNVQLIQLPAAAGSVEEYQARVAARTKRASPEREGDPVEPGDNEEPGGG